MKSPMKKFEDYVDSPAHSSRSQVIDTATETTTGLSGKGYALILGVKVAVLAGIVLPVTISAANSDNDQKTLKNNLSPEVAEDGFALQDIIPESENENGYGGYDFGNTNTHISMLIGKNCMLSDVTLHYEGSIDDVRDVATYSITTFPEGQFSHEYRRHQGQVSTVVGEPLVTTFSDSEDFASRVVGDRTCGDIAQDVALASSSVRVDK